ncbi:MAG: hypothetical protein IKT94_01635 [Rikenellaceae bacterium]|nr:hypothetical protein [Rikenellaceae bacterium]
MGYFSLFEARLALYEIKDFVKIFARPNKKKPHPHERGTASPETDEKAEDNLVSDYFFCFSWVSGFFAPASALVFS